MSVEANILLNESVAPVASISFVGFQVERFILEQEGTKTEQKLSYNVSFTPSGQVSWGQGRFQLKLDATVRSNDSNAFKAELVAYSFFSFDPQSDEKDVTRLLQYNTLSLMFPYIRSYVSAVTALSGLATVTMPTFNLTSLSETLKNNIVEVKVV